MRKISEKETCDRFITPAIEKGGWKNEQIGREITFTDGEIVVRGQVASRKEKKRADYILYLKPNRPLAIVEAKHTGKNLGTGMQQALEYANVLEYANDLDIPFVFSSNGTGFLFHDKTLTKGKKETTLTLDEFPTPEWLWEKYQVYKGWKKETLPLLTSPYYTDPSGKKPRYYQVNAINRTVEAIVQGEDRLLLLMATGTGKTYTAFQIIWRLWKTGVKKRILFLADRNILIDQARTQDFAPFKGAMTKVGKRQIKKSYEIYLSLYQAVSGSEEEKNIYKQFSPDFFDLVIIDECHRGSAREDSAWREILDYFESATHLGLTATPKETRETSSITYFGDPIYTYSLRQGIQDGFLAPYKVIRIDLNRDLEGWRPEEGKQDKHGRVIEDRIYNQRDFDRNLVLEKRTELIAKRITEYLQIIGPMSKTIIFCENIEHAERMRSAMINENPEQVQKNNRYVMQITGDNSEGKKQLNNFIDGKEKYPVIATTSKLLTTGVDAKTCKLIVLDQTINSLSDFKQTIGRGTRVNEKYGKLFFTIMDFRRATENFADPDFDGNPTVIYEPTVYDPVAPSSYAEEQEIGSSTVEEEIPPFPPPGPTSEERYGEEETGDQERVWSAKYYVDDVEVLISNERVQHIGPGGRLISESFKEYTRRNIEKEFTSLDQFVLRWNEAEKKKVILEELQGKGIFLKELAKEVGKEFDPFDLICHVAFGQPPLTRRERAEKVKKRNYFARYGEKAREVLQALLDKYADEGIANIEDVKVLDLQPLNQMGTKSEIIKGIFGGKPQYEKTLQDLKNELYQISA